METSGFDHIVLTVSDLERARQFYGDLLGFELTSAPKDYADLVFAGGYSFMIGEVEIGLISHKETSPGDCFNETRIGLDHLAFKAPNEAALHALVEKLVQAGIKTKGVELFEHSRKLSVTFRDPDNIQLEYWLDQPIK